MADFYVYVHCRADTGATFYVGKGTGDRAYRRTSRNRHWHNIVSKAGSFTSHLIARTSDEELALLAEVEMIDKLRRIGAKLANLTSGGEGVSGLRRKQSPEEIATRRASNTGKKRTPEQCARIAAAKVGHGVGHKHSNETRAKMSAVRIGKPHPLDGLKGRNRPAHVISALKAANDVRFSERRARLIDALHRHGDLSNARIATIACVDREMVARYRKLMEA